MELETYREQKLDYEAKRPDRKKLYEKILRVMEEIGKISKDKKNEFHNYKYVSDEAVVFELRGLLIKHKLVLLPDHSKEEKNGDLTRLEVRYRLVDVETGEQLISMVYGYGQDKGDKGIYKAATGAEKYFLLKTFLIPTTDDPENEARPTMQAMKEKYTEEPAKESVYKENATSEVESEHRFMPALITPKKSKNGKDYFVISDGEGSTFSTFSNTDEKNARMAIDGEKQVLIKYKSKMVNGKLYHSITHLEVLP